VLANGSTEIILNTEKINPMPSDNSSPPFSGIVYRSRINDITNLSHRDSAGVKVDITIEDLDNQFKDLAELDRIQSRTFDADSDGSIYAWTDFSNTINTMDENHWLQVDSDGYGNHILGNELDFRSERAGRENPPVYTIGITRLITGSSTADGLIEYQYNLRGNAQADIAIAGGTGKKGQTIPLISITATPSLIDGNATRGSVSNGDNILSSTALSSGSGKRGVQTSPSFSPAIISGNASIAEPPCQVVITHAIQASGDLLTGNATIESNDPHWYVLMSPVEGLNADDELYENLQYIETDPYYPGLNNASWQNPNTYYVDKVPPLGSGDWVASGNMQSSGAKIEQSVPLRQVFIDPDPQSPQNEMWLLAEDPIVRNYINYHNTQCFSFDGRYICTENFANPNSKAGRQIMIIDLETEENIFIENGRDPRWAKTSNTLYYVHNVTDTVADSYKTDYPSGLEVKKYDVATKTNSILCYGVENLGELSGDDTVLYGVRRFRDWKTDNEAHPGGRYPYPNDGVSPPTRTDPPSAPPAASAYGFGGEYEAVTMSTVTFAAPPSLPPADGWSPQLPVRFGDGSGKRPLPNPNHPPVMSRNKINWKLDVPGHGTIKGDTIFGRSRTWTNATTGVQDIALVLLQSGHPTWTGDGSYVVNGNMQLAGRKWDEPYPSNRHLLANERTSDPGAADPGGRWIVSGGNILDIRSGGHRRMSSPRTRLVFPTVNSLGQNQGDQSEAYDADMKGSPDGTKAVFVSTYKINGPNSNCATLSTLMPRGTTDAINVVSHDGWPEEGFFTAATEVIHYGSKTKDANGSNHRFLDITREVFRTTGVGKDTGFQLTQLEGRLIPENIRAPDAINATDELRDYYTTGMTPNWMRSLFQNGEWVNKFPNGTKGTINSGPLRFQRQTDVYCTVIRKPDAPLLRINDVNLGMPFGFPIQMIPGENHLEIKGYKIYKNGQPYPALPVSGEEYHWSPPKGGIVDNGQTLYIVDEATPLVYVGLVELGTYTVTAVEYSGLESKPSNPIQLDQVRFLFINYDKPADFKWTTESWFANGLPSTEEIATSASTIQGSKIVTHKGEEFNFDENNSGTLNVCLIQRVDYAFGNTVLISDYDHEGTITRKQYYNTISNPETEMVDNYLTKREYWRKAIDTTPDPTTGLDRPPEMVSKEDFNSSGVKFYEAMYVPNYNTKSGSNGYRPGMTFREAWWYDDGLNIEPSLRGPRFTGEVPDPNGTPKGEYWRYIGNNDTWYIYPACTPIRTVDKRGNFSRRVPANEFLSDGTTPNPLAGSHLWVSDGNQSGIYEDDTTDDPGNGEEADGNINYLDNVEGDDITGDGSLAFPWKTLTKALLVGINPGYTTIGIDNGPTNPYRINESDDNDRYYFSNKYGSYESPQTLKGDPNSNAYLRRDIDRPLTNPAEKYPNMYITQANVITGWENSTLYTGVWETANPSVRDLNVNKSILFSCSADVWDDGTTMPQGILGLVRALNVTWRDPSFTAANLAKGEFYMEDLPGKVYYRPKDGEDISTHHFEIADAGPLFTMKRIKHMTFEGLTIVGSGSAAFQTDGRGINRDGVTGDENDGVYRDDWCNDITLKNCYIKYTRVGTGFNIGENYLIDNCVCTDAMNGGFGFYGSKGNHPNDERGFPVRNTLIRDSRVAQCRSNDGIVWHSNSPYADVNHGNRIRWDDVGGNHKVLRCVSANNGENGFDITSGYDITLTGCTTHDNRHAGTTVAHYARNVKIIDQVSINDDSRRNFGGPLGIGDARDILVDNMKAYNPGLRFINITGDAQGIEIKNSTFTAGPDTTRSDLINVARGTDGEFDTVPRNNSTPVTRTPTSSNVGTGIATTVPQQIKDIHIHDCTFNIPFGAINTTNPGNSRFKLFLKMDVLPGLGFNVKLEDNVWNTSVLNTQWQPHTAQAVDGTNYGPYSVVNAPEARGEVNSYPRPANSSLYQPEVQVSGWQGYFAAGIFDPPSNPVIPPGMTEPVPYPGPTESLWDWWPIGVTPIGRETTEFSTEYLADRNLTENWMADRPSKFANYRVPFSPAVYNVDSGLVLNDTVVDLPLYLSAHVQSPSYWDSITVEGAVNSSGTSIDGSDYWERTNWTIASPSATGTSRASAYKDISSEFVGITGRNVSAECRWAGNHTTSAGPMVCVDASQTDFGLSLVWYSGTSGTDSFLALVEVGQSTDAVIVGISAPYPHTEGTELRLRIVVENGLIRCYAGTALEESTRVGINEDNSDILPLIPLTTTEGGSIFSNTYSVEDNNPNLNTSTTHGVYLINNQLAASRTDSLKYARYPDSLIPLPDTP
jgi:hypothetical protein